ncbi:MAG: hypothetical protein MUP02_09310, partial [Actinobacteria bacterium]|nr:hypothetical protein [Actinomycetota bacterium]
MNIKMYPKSTKLLLLFISILLMLTLFLPSQIFANGFSTDVTVHEGYADENTWFYLEVTGFNGSGYILQILKFNSSSYETYSTYTGTVSSDPWNQWI